LPVALIGLPGAVEPELNRSLADRSGRSLVALDDWPGNDRPLLMSVPLDRLADSDVRGRLRGRALAVWIDGADQALARRSGRSPQDIARLRKRHLVDLTTTADAIVGLADDLHGDGAGEDLAGRLVAAIAGANHPGASRVVTETVTFADGRSYPVHVGRGVIELLPELVPDRAKKVAVITQESIGLEVDSGREQRTFLVEDGERAKRLEEIGRLGSALARWELTRADVIVSVGGGVVSDLAGFLAASYHRGVPVIHVSTTLLGQIDAAIGGKCGVNLPEGKNLLGAFWQPTAVLCDIDSLSTLPPREFVSGMGELAKYHFLGGGMLDRVPLVDRVARSARIKANVVSGDEREGGRRAILNYGHTLAHALETAGRYDLRHGEAVAIGLVYAAELAHRLGRIDADRVAEHRRVVARYGLESTYAGDADHDEIVDLFQRDKKAIEGTTFVLDGPNGVEPVRIDDRTLLLDTLSCVSR